jgi:glycosyltransferase involved in cell wall biosynthesis
MKILMAARRYPPDVWSGTETVAASLYERARRRHEVQLVVGFVRARSEVPSEAQAVDLRAKSQPARWAAMAVAIFQAARRFKPDVVLSNNIEVPPTGRPTAIIVHDLNFGAVRAQDIEAQLRRRFTVARAGKADAVITVSAATGRTLVDLGLPTERLRVIPNGVDADLFAPNAATHAAAHAGDDRLHLVYASRFLPGKGQHLAIDAVARLPRADKERVRLTLVGAVVDRVYLDQLRVQAWGQPVDFAPDVPEMAPHYAAADVALFPTVMEEGFGYSAVEAMAAGLPVVWSDQPAIREATGGIGLPVPPGDVLALRAAIQQLLADPAGRARLGAEGRRYVQQNRSWDAVWDRYERALAELIAGRR